MNMTISGISSNIQLLLESTDKFKTVLPGPPTEDQNFEGYPAACHYYVDADSDYATVSQNRRILQFVVELYILPTDVSTESEVLTDKVYPLIDEVMQLFDESIDLSSQELALARACDFLRPAPSRLIPVLSQDGGKGWQMTINLYCGADVTFRNT